MPEALILKDVSKRYGLGLPVIDGLSHTFRPGTATGLVGPNGSGKTTLLRLLSTLAYPSSGSVHYGAMDIHVHPYAYLAHTGIVPDEAGLPQYLTAEELLTMVLHSRQRWADGSEHRIAHLLDQVCLDERRSALIGTYSSGMLKKTQIAAALAPDPDLLLLDEPLRGLDEESRTGVVTLLQSFTANGGVLIIASHLTPTLDALCDAFLELGRG